MEEVAGIGPGTVDLILTDIPYGQQFLPELDDLAIFAERVLVDGGLFVTYVGHCYLPAYFEAFGNSLNYGWQIASIWSGECNVVHRVNALSKWIPILVYSKGDWKQRPMWLDVLNIEEKEKSHHEWQKPLREVEFLVRNFSMPGDLVVDPCGGGFTTAAACFNLGRKCVACDIDPQAVGEGRKRLERITIGIRHLMR